MKKLLLLFVLFVLFFNCIAQRKVLFDRDWLFYKGDVQGGEQPGFRDATWRTVQLPHDYSIEDLPGTQSPFNPDVSNGVSIGFTTGGTGWYRKTFTLTSAQQNKVIYLQFDGVYMNADVWLNGEHLGNHPYGYTSFYYDITGKVKQGEKNVLAVRVKNEGNTSRWYSGSGINRHVWLEVMQPAHVAQWGTYITTSNVTAASAIVNVKTNVVNETGKINSVRLVTRIQNSSGKEVSSLTATQTHQSKSGYQFNQDIIVKSPQLWSPESPALYTAITEVFINGKRTDHTETKFGIRSLSFTAQSGFLLNGQSVKLKGGCFHIDNGPLGACAYERAEQRRVELMKESGFNAIRCSHNPPAPAFLDACDSLGMLVIDEAFDMWTEGKNDNDYHLYFNDWWQKDMESMLLRDRNHPSVIMWSIGNEIPNMDDPKVATLAKTLANYVHLNEPTRPVTAAVNSVSDQKDSFFAALDITGYNYAGYKYESDHVRKPDRIMFGTESYPLTAFDYWMKVVDHPYVIGDFVWTGFDYIGEASIGWRGYPQEKNFYPWNLAFCGDIDICGWKRPQSYYRDALWKKDQLSLFVKPPQPSFPLNPKTEPWSIWNWNDVVADWNWQGAEGKPLEVNVYSSCDEVELFLNGKSLGKQPTNRSVKFTAAYTVPYTKGELKAVGYTNGKQVNTSVLQTAGEATQIKLSADREVINADGEDISYVTVEVLDADGNRNPKAENEIQFAVQGAGTIAGVGNANPTSLESYQQPQRKAWQGRCIVVIKSNGQAGSITLKATTNGLKSDDINITAR